MNRARRRCQIDPARDDVAAALRARAPWCWWRRQARARRRACRRRWSATARSSLLQPRRVAARSIARRIADEQGWTLGREVGWHVRFDRRISADTRLLVATEGILTARLQQDPLLTDFATIVLDEFHERSIHADLGIALARQAWLARDDLAHRGDVGHDRRGAASRHFWTAAR